MFVWWAVGHEAIVLQDRKGLVKLAIRTGAALVPCYLFGNTKLYSMWYGGDNEKAPLRLALRWMSRKLGMFQPNEQVIISIHLLCGFKIM